MVKNFPLSLLIFNVNFSLSADDLALVTVITPPAKSYLTEITTVFYINPIHAIFSSKLSTIIAFLGPKFFHSDTQARLQFWDTVSAPILPIEPQDHD